MIALDASPLVLGPPRGVARALWGLVEGLARVDRPEPVRLFAPGPLPPGVPPLDGVVVAPHRTRRAASFRRQLPGLLARERARVLYAPWAAFPRTSVPVVVTVHEVPFVRHGPLEGRVRALRHRRWLRRDLGAQRVLVPSRATYEDLLASGFAADRVHVLPNAFDPRPWEAAGRRAGPRGPDVLVVGTGAGRGRKKGLDVLIAALDLLGEARPAVTVVGRTRFPPREGVLAVPWLPDRELAALVASARLLVHPARSEGFGYPPLEAMAAGTPVVASEAASIPEVVGDAALLVPPGDPAALARAISRALLDDALRELLVRRGHARAHAFSPEATARRFLDLLGQVS